MNRPASPTALIAFLLIFPAFSFYQIAVALEIINPIFGGYFTIGALLALPFATASYLKNTKINIKNIPATGIAFIFFILIFSGSIAIGEAIGVSPEITTPHAAYVLKFIALFLVARSVNGESATVQKISAFIILTIAASIIYARIFHGEAIFTSVTNSGFEIDYHGLAFSYLVIAVYGIPYFNTTARHGVYIISALSLYIIGARSEFIAFFFLTTAIEVCLSKHRAINLTSLLISSIALFFFATLLSNSIDFSENRILRLLQIKDDASAIERISQIEAAIQTIENHPILGSYGSYPPGHYAHNLLSAWVDLGLAGLIVTLILIFSPLISLAIRFKRDSRKIIYSQSLAISTALALLLITSKAYIYQMIPVAAGLYCRYHSSRLRQRKEQTSHQHPLHGKELKRASGRE